jgi:PleD family two-component response regulator
MLLKMADGALYEAKRAGRNQCSAGSAITSSVRSQV